MAQDQREKRRLKLEVRFEPPLQGGIGAVTERVSDSAIEGNSPNGTPAQLREAVVESSSQASRSPPWGPISFLVTVVAPALACLLYLVLLAAPQFVSETRFVIRGSLETLAIDSIGQAAALSALNNSQEAHVVADYIRGPRIVRDLSKEFDLRRIYAGSPLDFVWHLPADASADRLVRYWQNMATAEVDATTGIITVRIHAFNPEDAQALNRAVIKLSETLVAGFTHKMRAQRLEETLADSEAAQSELTTLFAALETQRGREGTLDPLTTATTYATLVSTLRDERATLVAAREAAAARLSAAAPTLALSDERIRALDAQIELILDATTRGKPDASAASDLLSAASLFDFLQTRRELVARRVSQTQTALAQARQDTIRQQIYVVIFMQPTLGETKDHPRPALTALLVLLALAAIWAIAALYFQSIRERTR